MTTKTRVGTDDDREVAVHVGWKFEVNTNLMRTVAVGGREGGMTTTIIGNRAANPIESGHTQVWTQ